MKNEKIFLIPIALMLFTIGVIAEEEVTSRNVIYDNSVSNSQYNTVQGAIEDLYEKINSKNCEQTQNITCPPNKDCVKKIGQLITIEGEDFYVIESNQHETKLIARYNLLVGKSCDIADANKASTCTDIPTSTSNYGKQSASTNISDTLPESYGVIDFSETTYWLESGSYNVKDKYTDEVNDRKYVYDSNSKLYTYIENYKNNVLNANSNIVKEARLMTKEEAINLGCQYYVELTCPSWLTKTGFWLGTEAGAHIYAVAETGNHSDYLGGIVLANGGNLGTNYFSYQNNLGVRPVIVVNTSEI